MADPLTLSCLGHELRLRERRDCNHAINHSAIITYATDSRASHRGGLSITSAASQLIILVIIRGTTGTEVSNITRLRDRVSVPSFPLVGGAAKYICIRDRPGKSKQQMAVLPWPGL
jgi:hypothetical protein